MLREMKHRGLMSKLFYKVHPQMPLLRRCALRLKEAAPHRGILLELRLFLPSAIVRKLVRKRGLPRETGLTMVQTLNNSNGRTNHLKKE